MVGRSLAGMLVERQVVVISAGFHPDRVGDQSGLGELEGPGGDRRSAVGCGGAADRHDRADEFGMHQPPHVGLGGAHRDASGENDMADIELVDEQAVIGLHHVVVGVVGKLLAEPV